MALAVSEIAAREAWSGPAIRAAIDAHRTITLLGGEASCHNSCIRILAETDLRIILAGHVEEQAGQLLSKASGDACLASENRYLYLRFLEAGYAAVRSSRTLRRSKAALPFWIDRTSIGRFGSSSPGRAFRNTYATFSSSKMENGGSSDAESKGRLEPALSPADTVIGFLFGMRLSSARIGPLWPSSEAFLSAVIGMSLDET